MTKFLRLLSSVLLVAAAVALPLAASAVSSFVVTGGQLSTVQFVDATGAPVPCPIGSTANCLVAPVAIGAGTLTLDTTGGQLLDLGFGLSGTGSVVMGGVNGLSTVDFFATAYQSSGAVALSALGGGNFNFGPMPGTVTTSVTFNPLAGPSVGVSGTSFASAPSGTIFTSLSTANLSLIGVDLGQVCDPLNPQNCLFVKADFNLIAAAIPEPSAALVFGIGALVVGAGTRRSGRTSA